MKKILMLLCLSSLLMSHTCTDDDRYYYHDYPCTEEARAGLNVNVSLNGNPNVSADGITVTARSGNYIEDLFPNIPDTPSFSGAYERAGNYIITVSKQGYETFVSNPVRVERDECHVIPRIISVNLIPEN
ncbi:carboxypeptidase-like regulatory domain-containing protein [Flavobacterium sp.]|uniref:carboxypeptidase-like regulatory domain-containing protein n=1 Tax=Flavobacterium sp. TaxID=239 RepID=UPI0039E5D3DB